jgi:hypothetical protein
VTVGPAEGEHDCSRLAALVDQLSEAGGVDPKPTFIERDESISRPNFVEQACGLGTAYGLYVPTKGHLPDRQLVDTTVSSEALGVV